MSRSEGRSGGGSEGRRTGTDRRVAGPRNEGGGAAPASRSNARPAGGAAGFGAGAVGTPGRQAQTGPVGTDTPGETASALVSTTGAAGRQQQGAIGVDSQQVDAFRSGFGFDPQADASPAADSANDNAARAVSAAGRKRWEAVMGNPSTDLGPGDRSRRPEL